jgi:hypothetical protein
MMAVQVVTALPTATTADGFLGDTISPTALLPPPPGAAPASSRRDPLFAPA